MKISYIMKIRCQSVHFLSVFISFSFIVTLDDASISLLINSLHSHVERFSYIVFLRGLLWMKVDTYEVVFARLKIKRSLISRCVSTGCVNQLRFDLTLSSFGFVLLLHTTYPYYTKYNNRNVVKSPKGSQFMTTEKNWSHCIRWRIKWQ